MTERLKPWLQLGLIGTGLSLCQSASASMEADPLLYQLSLDRMEYRNSEDGSSRNIELSGWVGKDINKFYWSAERTSNSGSSDSAELDFGYTRAISPFFDARLGIRREFESGESEDSLSLGVSGLAPYLVDTEVMLYFYDSGQVSWSAEFEYEAALNQRWVLKPSIELQGLGVGDSSEQQGGISSIEASLHLHRYISRSLSVYIGVNKYKYYKQDAEQRQAEGLDTELEELRIGVSFWL